MNVDERRIVFDLKNSIYLVENTLSKYVGTVVAEVCEKRFILTSLLDEYFHGTDSEHLNRIFEDFKLPAAVKQNLLTEIRQRMFSTIQNGFEFIYPSRHYSYELKGESIFVLEQPHRTVEIPPASIEDQDDGWTPERMRQR